jgi:arginyl-tRNA synthetase
MPLLDLEETLRGALSAAVAEYSQSNEGIQVGLPPRPELGDLATNAALILAKRLGKSPMEIATALTSKLLSAKEIAAADALAPGFINIRFHDELLHRFADWFRREQHTREGRIEPCARHEIHSTLQPVTPAQKIILEFVSANPTGPLNVVSARAGAAGDHLARLWLARGHRVDCEYYVNDVGRQVELLVKSVLARVEQARKAFEVGIITLPQVKHFADLVRLNPSMPLESFSDDVIPPEGYRGVYIILLALFILSRHSEWLQASDLTEKVVLLMTDWCFGDLAQMRVEDLNIVHQHQMHEGLNPLDERVLEIYAKDNLSYEKDGALWLRSTSLGDEQDWVLVRRDGGAETYLLADIAYHLDKARRGYDLAVNIWGPDHHAHIKRLQNALTPVLREEGFISSEQQGSDFLKIIISQQVNLVDRSGESVKMSKRQGNLVTLHEVLAELGVDVTRYFFLDRSLSSHLDFNLELARQQTPENPIFRIQYATARIASLIRKAREQGEYSVGDAEWTRLESPAERNLMRLIAEMPRSARQAADSWEVHRVPAALLELAGEFHRWYDSHRILGIGDEGLTMARLALAESIRGALGWGLDLLGISAPESM